MRNTEAEGLYDAVDLTVLGLGVIAGMRAFSAPAVVCLKLSKDAAAVEPGPWLTLASSRQAAWFWTLLAAGEMVADKVPGMPNRTDPLSLVGRISSGAVCGALVSRSARRNAIGGALLGALSAAGSTFLTYHFRQKLANRISDPLAAVAEDAVVIACGRAILNSRNRVR